MVTRILTVALCALAAAASTATAAQPVEGYHDPGNRIGCVMFQAYDKHGNAVECGRKGRAGGLLLTSAGPSQKASWSWPGRRFRSVFFEITYGTTYYLYGGTAKAKGDASILRCVFRRRPAVRVRCTNGDGYAIEVSRARLRRIAP